MSMYPAFEQMIEQENARFLSLQRMLGDFSTRTGGAQGLEQIYAALVDAYNQGIDAMDRYKNDLMEASLLSAGYLGRLSPEQKARVLNLPPKKQQAIFHLIGCTRALKRPSDVYRVVVSEYAAGIAGALSEMAYNPQNSPDDFYKNVVSICDLLCFFDQIEDEKDAAAPAGGSWWERIISGGVGFLVGMETQSKAFKGNFSAMFDELEEQAKEDGLISPP